MVSQCRRRISQHRNPAKGLLSCDLSEILRQAFDEQFMLTCARSTTTMKLNLRSRPLSAALLIITCTTTFAIPVRDVVKAVDSAALDNSPCDRDCANELISQTAYSACSSGVENVMAAYDSLAWCSKGHDAWCRDTVDSSISAIASKAANSSGPIDLDGPDNVYLLSTLSQVSSTAALWGMRWAEETFNFTGKPVES